jgi:hypothetical protein
MDSLSQGEPHMLKVRNIGDRYRKEVIPQIRLQGKWLLNTGIRPGTHVQITNPCNGELVIKSLDDQA